MRLRDRIHVHRFATDDDSGVRWFAHVYWRLNPREVDCSMCDATGREHPSRMKRNAEKGMDDWERELREEGGDMPENARERTERPWIAAPFNHEVRVLPVNGEFLLQVRVNHSRGEPSMTCTRIGSQARLALVAALTEGKP